MIVFILTLIGTAMLCLSMRKHWKQVLPDIERSPRAAMAVRAGGYALLLAAAIVSADLYGTGVGMTLFFALFTVAHFAVAVILPYRWNARAGRRS